MTKAWGKAHENAAETVPNTAVDKRHLSLPQTMKRMGVIHRSTYCGSRDKDPASCCQTLDLCCSRITAHHAVEGNAVKATAWRCWTAQAHRSMSSACLLPQRPAHCQQRAEIRGPKQGEKQSGMYSAERLVTRGQSPRSRMTWTWSPGRGPPAAPAGAPAAWPLAGLLGRSKCTQ